jgi:Chromo (CHRromatin Organisation MOdifier) domain
VSKILSARFTEQDIFHEFLVTWRGFPVREATWEPYTIMDVDDLGMVTKFTTSYDDPGMAGTMRSRREFSWGSAMRYLG